MSPEEIVQLVQLLSKLNSTDSARLLLQVYNANVTQYYGCTFHGAVPTESKADGQNDCPKAKPSSAAAETTEFTDLLKKMKEPNHSTRPSNIGHDFNEIQTIKTFVSPPMVRNARVKPTSVEIPYFPSLPSLMTNAPSSELTGGQSSTQQEGANVSKQPSPTVPAENQSELAGGQSSTQQEGANVSKQPTPTVPAENQSELAGGQSSTQQEGANVSEHIPNYGLRKKF